MTFLEQTSSAHSNRFSGQLNRLGFDAGVTSFARRFHRYSYAGRFGFKGGIQGSNRTSVKHYMASHFILMGHCATPVGRHLGRRGYRFPNSNGGCSNRPATPNFGCHHSRGPPAPGSTPPITGRNIQEQMTTPVQAPEASADAGLLKLFPAPSDRQLQTRLQNHLPIHCFFAAQGR